MLDKLNLKRRYIRIIGRLQDSFYYSLVLLKLQDNRLTLKMAAQKNGKGKYSTHLILLNRSSKQNGYHILIKKTGVKNMLKLNHFLKLMKWKTVTKMEVLVNIYVMYAMLSC